MLSLPGICQGLISPERKGGSGQAVIITDPRAYRKKIKGVQAKVEGIQNSHCLRGVQLRSYGNSADRDSRTLGRNQQGKRPPEKGFVSR